MTERKSFKRRVRARMEKTGERYTAAGRPVAGEEPAPALDAGPVASEAAVVQATGKTWDEWYALLDGWGAAGRTHGEIARHLHNELGVPGWWAQSVTVGYERARGLRAKHQKADGFAVGVAKTIAVEPERAFAAFVEPEERGRFLPDAPLGLRTAQPPRSARFDWGEGPSRVHVVFDRKGPAKTTVSVEHARLADADTAERAKGEWRERLARFKEALEQ